MDIALQFGGGLAIGLLAAISPGPDTVLVLRSVAAGGARAGIRAAAGIGAALLVHAVLTLGVVFTVQDVASSIVLKVMQLAGAAYLAYLGVSLIRSARHTQAADADHDGGPIQGYFRQGLLTNLTNPKAIVFFGAIVSQFITNQNVTAGAAVLLGILTAVPAWFVALSFGSARLMGRLSTGRRQAVDLAAGILFIALAAFGVSTFFLS
jgi:threonine/homoserine/homoserine lactone efflux protein